MVLDEVFKACLELSGLDGSVRLGEFGAQPWFRREDPKWSLVFLSHRHRNPIRAATSAGSVGSVLGLQRVLSLLLPFRVYLLTLFCFNFYVFTLFFRFLSFYFC